MTTKAGSTTKAPSKGDSKSGSTISGSTTSSPEGKSTSSPKKLPLTRELSHDRCGDPIRRFHYKKFDSENIAQGLTELDACCTSPFLTPDSDAKIINADCCLVQGSVCEEGGVPCCKNAKCSKTPSGNMRCPFESGFWSTSKQLQVPAVKGWRPSTVPRYCLHSKYSFYRQITPANLTIGKQPITGCCALQDTTESALVKRYCCVNINGQCCFSNGYCTEAISSQIVSYEEKENDFQIHLDDKVLQEVVYRT